MQQVWRRADAHRLLVLASTLLTLYRWMSRLENSPNPFRTSTNITFTLGPEARVTLEVFDLAGRLVATPIRDEQLPAGPYQREFRDPGLPSGLYLSRLTTGSDVITGRMLLLQ